MCVKLFRVKYTALQVKWRGCKLKIIDAIWEKRNLGTDVFEVQCEREDCIEELYTALHEIKTPYSVCKIPSGSVNLLKCAQELGYQVIEMSICMEGSLKDIILPKIYERFMKDVDIKEANAEEIECVMKHIEQGELFATDRIAVDSYFGKKIAGIRYSNWVKDLLPKGARVSIALFKNVPVAFGINIDRENSVSDAFLGGLLENGVGSGLGFLALYANIVTAKKYGNKKIVSSVSSNNQAIINLHLQFGYRIKNMHYVLIKHQ